MDATPTADSAQHGRTGDHSDSAMPGFLGAFRARFVVVAAT